MARETAQYDLVNPEDALTVTLENLTVLHI